MPKIVDKGQMREQILNAAVQAFLTHGFHNTTMERIAKEASIAKGTLYLYFNSKEHLSVAFVESYFQKMEQWLTQQGRAETRDALIAQLKHALLIDQTQARFIPIFFEAFGPSFRSAAFRQTIAEAFDKMGVFYSDTLSYLITKGEVDQTLNAKAYGRVLVSMIDGVMLHYGLFGQTESEYHTMVNEMLMIVQKGLSA